jgi:hypothetical protein
MSSWLTFNWLLGINSFGTLDVDKLLVFIFELSPPVGNLFADTQSLGNHIATITVALD